MNRLLMLTLVMVLGVALLVPATPAEAATVYENFDSYADSTPANSLTTPGATFNGPDWGVIPTFFSSLTGKVLIQPGGGGNPLTIDFATPKGSYSMRFATQQTGDTFRVWGYYEGVLQFTDDFVGSVPSGFPFAEGSAYGSGDKFDRLVVDALGQAAAIDDLIVYEFVDRVDYPNRGEILISAGAPVTAYGEPGGEVARGTDGRVIVLPADYDGNGFDTYIVTGTATLAGELWYSIWIGGKDYGWVKGSQVVTLR